MLGLRCPVQRARQIISALVEKEPDMWTSRRGTCTFEPLEGRSLLNAHLLIDLGPGKLHSAPAQLTKLHGTVYFRAGHHVAGQTSPVWWLWKTDGTAPGTQPVIMPEGVEPGFERFSTFPGSQYLRDLIVARDRLFAYEIKHQSTHVFDLWLRSVGPRGDVTRHHIGQMNESDPGYPALRPPITVDGALHFFWPGRYDNHSNSFIGRTWYTADEHGAPVAIGGTNPNQYTGSGPAYDAVVKFNGATLYRFDDGVHGSELWIDEPGSTAPTVARDAHSDSATPRDDGVDVDDILREAASQ
jgi:hypothetical protein